MDYTKLGCLYFQKKNTEIVYGERLQPFFSHLFHTFIFSAIDCFRPFHFRFQEGNELFRKKAQGVSDMTEDNAGIFIMNNKYYVNDIAFEEIFLIM